MATPEAPEPVIRWGTFVGYVLGAFAVSVVVSYQEVDALGDAWQACDIGSETAHRFQLVIMLCLLIVAHLVLLGIGLAVYAGTRVPLVWIVLATGFAVLALGWMFFAWTGLPITAEACPGGAPSWWPDWLPPEPRPNT